MIPAVMNPGFAVTDAFVPFPPIGTIDWESVSNAEINTQYWCLPIKGILFDPSNDLTNPPSDGLPSLPCHYNDPSTGGYGLPFQGFMSTWAMETWVNTTMEAVPFKGWLNSTDTGLTTSSPFLKTIMPGLKNGFGPDQPVNIWMDVMSMTDITSS